MRIFVAGATGAIGRKLLPRLVQAGHDVTGLAHSPAKAEAIRALGAEPVVGDALDAIAVQAAVDSTRPDVIVHELTGLSASFDLRYFERTFAVSNQLRTEGTDNLLAAARSCGVKRIVAQSYCGWPYAREGERVKTEADALDTSPPKDTQGTLHAIKHVESAVTQSVAPEGVVLRYGAFYGCDTGMFEESALNEIRRRRFPVLGDGEGWWSFIDIDDAAAATVLAIERGKAGQIYNIVDDEPTPVREWLPALANIIGAKPPLRLPAWFGRLLVGEAVMVMMTTSRAGSNAKAKSELGWRPMQSSWRQGFVEAMAERQRSVQAA